MSPTEARDARLTPRQLEVLELLAKGLTNPEIASALGISVGTAKNHVSAVIDALDVTNRTEAAVVLGELRANREPERDPVPGFGERPAIAILPFDNLSDDPGQDLFAAGLVEDLTTGLAAFRWFPVISRTSSFAVRERPLPVTEVCRLLGARYVIEGSTRRVGDRVRIHVQLIDGQSDRHLLAERLDKSVSDVLGAQDEIVEGVVGALEPVLLRAEAQRVGTRPAESLDAWEHFQRATSLVEEHTPEALEEAVGHFDAAIAAEPGFAAPHAGRALALHLRGLFHVGSTNLRPTSPEEMAAAIDRARSTRREAADSARRATRIDPLDARGWVGLGLCLPRSRAPEARSALERALELNPSAAIGCWALANHLVAAEEWEEAQWLFERAIRLSPRDAYVHHFEGALAGLHFELGRDEEAVRHARRSVDLQPSDRSSYRPVLAAALGHLGRSEEAMQQVQIVRALYPDWNLRLVREMASARFVERLVEGFRIGGWDLRDRLDS